MQNPNQLKPTQYYEKTLLIIILIFPDANFYYGFQADVKGTVYDYLTREPLPGVTIQIEGTTRGTVTDVNGAFSLSGVQSGDVLIFSFIGYIREERQVDASEEIIIMLIPDMQLLMRWS
jgi:TonB-dependent starch-binding outer membrane protein SusC